jgi:transcriptional regulator with XRE-family HTH domain
MVLLHIYNHENGTRHTSPEEKVMELGALIRRIRNERQRTLAEVAKATNLTASLLSQIETGKTAPSLHSLETLLRYYGVPMSDFFRQVEQKEHIIVRAGETETLAGNEPGVRLTLLASKLEQNVLESYLAGLDPDMLLTPARTKTNGERFVYMLRGRMEAKFENESQPLGPGDSMNFKSGVTCQIVNTGGEYCEFILTGTMPLL